MMRLQLVMGLGIPLLCAASAARGQAVDPRAEARAAIIRAYLSADTDSINGHIADAIRYGRLAVAQQPQDAESHYWLAAALGRRTQRADITGALKAGRESYREARQVVALGRPTTTIDHRPNRNTPGRKPREETVSRERFGGR